MILKDVKNSRMEILIKNKKYTKLPKIVLYIIITKEKKIYERFFCSKK